MIEGCVLCANGNDLPEGEYCRACGREGTAFGLGAAVIKARGRQEPPRIPVAFDTDHPGPPNTAGVTILTAALGKIASQADNNWTRETARTALSEFIAFYEANAALMDEKRNEVKS